MGLYLEGGADLARSAGGGSGGRGGAGAAGGRDGGGAGGGGNDFDFKDFEGEQVREALPSKVDRLYDLPDTAGTRLRPAHMLTTYYLIKIRLS